MFELVASADYDEYLAGLNRSFGDWGGRHRLDWVLRPFAGMVHEVFGHRVDGRLVAGSIVSYRIVGNGDEERVIGIMTGSWTDPELRGRGMFSDVIAHSAEAVRARGGAALLAFVTANNASRGRLEHAGSTLVPTWYLSIPTASLRDADRSVWHPVADSDSALATVDARRRSQAGSRVRFLYPDVADLAGQWLGRSSGTRVLESDAGSVAVIEDAGGTTRLLAGTPGDFGTPEVFSFSADPAMAERVPTHGSRVVDGFLTVLPVDQDWAPPASWHIDHGDRI